MEKKLRQGSKSRRELREYIEKNQEDELKVLLAEYWERKIKSNMEKLVARYLEEKRESKK